MIKLPAIDLKSGQCVRLTQGSYDQVTIYERDPVLQAKLFEADGAKALHIVDLDGAKSGQSINLDIIRQIATETNLEIQTGGGIRTLDQLNTIFNMGIQKAILGSIAISDVKTTKKWIAEFGADRIVLALDIRFNTHQQPILSIHGWQKNADKNLWQLLDEYQNSGLKHVLCTDIMRDGLLQGPNINLYKACVTRYPDLNFQASGGVSALIDLKKLFTIPISEVIIGKALYENKFSLKDALCEIELC